MARLENWLINSNDFDHDAESAQSILAYQRINDNPTSVSFRKPNGTTLDPQTVRIESYNTARETSSVATTGPARRVIIYGIRNHPTLTDTNIAEGYRFVHTNDEYRVIDTMLAPGEIQGIAEAVG